MTPEEYLGLRDNLIIEANLLSWISMTPAWILYCPVDPTAVPRDWKASSFRSDYVCLAVTMVRLNLFDAYSKMSDDEKVMLKLSLEV